MRAATALVSLALAASLSACVGASYPDVTIDFGGVCFALDLALRDPNGLLDGAEVHAFAASDPSGAGWALIDFGPNSLALQRIPSDPDEAPQAPIPLGLGADSSADVHLLAGPEVGEVCAGQHQPRGAARRDRGGSARTGSGSACRSSSSPSREDTSFRRWSSLPWGA